MMKKIGTIIITISILIGVFIVPINAIETPIPSFSFGVQNNFLKYENFYTDNCTISLTESGGLQITTSGNGNTCNVFMANQEHSLSLSSGTYRFGFVREQDYNFRINMFFDGVSEYLSSNSSSTFSIDSPSVVVCFIQIPSAMNNSVQTFSCLPYLIYENDMVGEVLSAVQSSMTAPFSAVANGFTFVANSMFGVDGKLSAFGVVLIFVLTVPIVIWGIGTIFDFLRKPLRKR